ncbi:hypothetical protein BC835DRAFT_1418924 [Cytidiella melzeri]|nr:hypothetical protein BC835DRAFT_1418924 [Cytidiella melzeri]
MSHRHRKRAVRRSPFSPEHDSPAHATEDKEDDVEQLQRAQNAASESPPDAEQAAKEQEIWDSLREENYEAVEQLPLSLHRAYALIHELDQQVHDYNRQLMQALHAYVTARTTLAHPAANTPDVSMDVDISPNQTTSQQRMRMESPRPSRSQARSVPSTRELLRTIAQSSEGVMTASHEKLSVARFACDLIDRHNRDLERAIKEQETSLSVGLRPGTHPASIILPEVVVPPASRAPRTVHSPIPEDDDSFNESLPRPEHDAIVDLTQEVPRAPTEKPSRKRTRGRVAKRTEGSAVPKASSSSPQRQVITLTVPPLISMATENNSSQPMDQQPVDDEPRYCYCNGISAGTMIGCDAQNCRYQWFHMECLKMKQVPQGDYICPDCSRKAAGRRKKR